MKQKIFTATMILASGIAMSSAFAAGDAVKGEAIFKKCAACHMVGEGAKNKVGPILTNVVGGNVASVEGYKYGKSIIAFGETGATWTEEELFEWLANPKKYLRAKLDDKKAKSKMSFKLKKEDQRKDVIAYLATFAPKTDAESETSEESESTN